MSVLDPCNGVFHKVMQARLETACAAAVLLLASLGRAASAPLALIRPFWIRISHPVPTPSPSTPTYVYRATDTKFSLTTKTGSTATPPVLTNFVWSGGTFGFDLLTSAGQTVTVLSTTNLATPLASWPVLETVTKIGSELSFY